jgi:hypothetical protein
MDFLTAITAAKSNKLLLKRRGGRFWLMINPYDLIVRMERPVQPYGLDAVDVMADDWIVALQEHRKHITCDDEKDIKELVSLRDKVIKFQDLKQRRFGKFLTEIFSKQRR